MFFFLIIHSKSAEHPYLWENSHRRLQVLEKPKTHENLPTPPSWDVELSSRGVSFESSDLLKNGFRSHIKRGFWKVSAHLVRSRSGSDPQTCPAIMKKMMKITKKSDISKSIRDHLGSFPELQEMISDGF